MLVADSTDISVAGLLSAKFLGPFEFQSLVNDVRAPLGGG